MTETPPAFTAFDAEISARTGKDLRKGFRLWLVYRHLRGQLTFNTNEPRVVKVAAVHMALRMSPNAVTEALDWLCANGYLLQEGRTERNVRRLSLAWDIQPKQAA